MKPSKILSLSAKLLLSMTLFFVCPVLLSAQSNNKKNNTPPPQNSAPPPKPAVKNNTPNRPPATKPAQPNTTKTGPPNGAKPGQPNLAKPAQPNVLKPGIVKTSPGPAGSTHGFDKNGKLSSVTTSSGVEARYNASGRVSTIKAANGTTIVHSSTGARTIVSERVSSGGEHYHVVNGGLRGSYVEHRFQRGGRDYMRRTYVYGGHTRVAIYRGYHHHDHLYYGYVPGYYYHPGFYGWAYAPWGAPVPYAWGWATSPWYGWYGYYWNPYPVYPSAAFWLTDYLVSENLQAAYEARAQANASAAQDQAGASQQPEGQNNPPALSPEVKQMIAEEVKAQLAAEQAAAAQPSSSIAVPASSTPQPSANTDPVPPALDPNLRIFIVTASLDVTASGQGCSLSPGDVLMRTENTPDKDDTVAVSVVSSQKSDCTGGSSPRIQVADLQEMHNHFREQMDNGLKTLADKQGKGGIPAAPATGGRNNPEGTAIEDLSATADLKKQQDDANQAEKEVQQASSTGSAGGNN
jgi:hypothetical protein